MSISSSARYGAVSSPSAPAATERYQATPASPPFTFFSPARAHTESALAAWRPWRELFDLSSSSKPYSYSDAVSRVRRNLFYFRVNYALVMLLVLFFGLVYHPISMIVCLIVFVAWLFLYFVRNGPVVMYNWTIDDRAVLVGLSLVTIGALVFTGVGLNVLVALVIGVVFVGLHAAFRGNEDLFLDENEAAEGGLLSVVGGEPMKTSYAPIR